MATSPSATLQSAQDCSIYILLTRSGTWFSRLIHLVTSDCYTHASIGLDGPSGPFYSFARKYEHFALPAGLVECGAVELWKNPDLVRPADFCRLSALQAVHQGPLDGLMAAPT